MGTAFADGTTGSRSRMDNSATGARGGDAGSSPSTSNVPASTGQTGDGTPTIAYGNTDTKAIEGTTSIETGVGATPNGTSPRKAPLVAMQKAPSQVIKESNRPFLGVCKT